VLKRSQENIRTVEQFWDVLPIQNGLMQYDTLLLLLFNVFQPIFIWKIQENQKVLELNGTHRLLVYGVNFFQRSARKNREIPYQHVRSVIWK
jgi:hypothetical protein